MCVLQCCFLYEGVSESQNTLNSRSRNLKSQNVSGSQRKMLAVSLSRKVSPLPFATSNNGCCLAMFTGAAENVKMW